MFRPPQISPGLPIPSPPFQSRALSPGGALSGHTPPGRVMMPVARPSFAPTRPPLPHRLFRGGWGRRPLAPARAPGGRRGGCLGEWLRDAASHVLAAGWMFGISLKPRRTLASLGMMVFESGPGGTAGPTRCDMARRDPGEHIANHWVLGHDEGQWHSWCSSLLRLPPPRHGRPRDRSTARREQEINSTHKALSATLRRSPT